MQYFSTRSKTETAAAAEAILQGLAPDGGLYVPAAIPDAQLDDAALLSLDQYALTAHILKKLLPGVPNIAASVEAGYRGKFEGEDLTPTVPVQNAHVLELYHGPTSAFKDMALCLLPYLVAESGKAVGQKEDVLVLTATSGDTGKAALAGFANAPHTRVMVFYPDGGVSEVQRAQMVTQEGDNVCVAAVKGNFDDAQRGVKEVFSAFKGTHVRLSSANSINIGRLAPQVAYYFKAYADLRRQGTVKAGEQVDFVVPTGNFGNILAGYIAKKMGLPVGTLVCASNENDVLTEFLQTGVYDRRRTFHKTASPSMDILVSSNLERLLYFASDGDDALVASLMKDLSEKGFYKVPDALLQKIQSEFACGKADDAQAFDAIRRVWEEEQYLMDPHTAVAWRVYEDYRKKSEGRRAVILSTASPYKFAPAMLTALHIEVPESGFRAMELLHERTGVPVPAGLASLKEKAVRHKDVIDPKAMLSYVEEKSLQESWR
ncbi:MAG: threonine synthase [Clostridiales bacterium]|nr:threonine synthase [Clostridiales bacterium]